MALANYYSASGQREKAVAELKSLGEAKPKDVSVKAALVDTLLDLGRFKEAEAAIEQPLKKNPVPLLRVYSPVSEKPGMPFGNSRLTHLATA